LRGIPTHLLFLFSWWFYANTKCKAKIRKFVE